MQLAFPRSLERKTIMKCPKVRGWRPSRSFVAAIFLGLQMALGMFLFSYLESPNEQQLNKPPKIIERKIDLGKVTFETNALLNTGEIQFEYLEIGVDRWNDSHLILRFIQAANIDSNTDSTRLKWDYPGALFFCMTVLTTIGYGNLSPATDLGRLVCVIFAIFGLPVFAIVLESCKDLYLKFALFVEHYSTLLITKQAPNTAVAHFHKRYSIILIFIFGYLLMLLLPSVIFWYVENWQYLSAVYYNFVSLSTIGFGDMVAGQAQEGDGAKYSDGAGTVIYRLFLSVWILAGIPFASHLLDMWKAQLERFIDFLLLQFSSTSNATVPSVAENTGTEEQTHHYFVKGLFH